MECSETQVTLHYENMTVKQRQYYTECLLFDLGTNLVGSTRKVRHRRPCLKWFSVMPFVL